VPHIVGAAAEAVLSSRGDAQRLRRVVERNRVPMVLVDDRRRYVEVNSPARLAFRRGMDEMRHRRIDDLAPAHGRPVIDAAWARLLDTGCVSGRFEAPRQNGCSAGVHYWALANALSGLHLVAFAPADWPDPEHGVPEADDGQRPLTPREREVQQLAAEGVSGPAIAERLVVSPGTVKTHFRNIYEKLGVRGRAAAVAKGLRLAFID
jgi:DNA-binding CsgD family transcriptional regulator